MSLIELDQVYISSIFRNAPVFDGTTEPYPIEQYEAIVTKYIQNNFKLDQTPPPDTSNRMFSIIVVPSESLSFITVKPGDIVMNGPPDKACIYGFTGIFTNQGKLTSAIVQDWYSDYSIRNTTLAVSPGRNLECEDRGNLCTVTTNFQLDEKHFQLSPGESYEMADGPITSIRLVKSTVHKPESPATGTETSVNYILEFSESELTQTKPGVTLAEHSDLFFIGVGFGLGVILLIVGYTLANLLKKRS